MFLDRIAVWSALSWEEPTFRVLSAFAAYNYPSLDASLEQVVQMGTDSVDRELLDSALDRGYFETPPRVSVRELGEEFDLSEAEVRRRLSRTLATMLKERCEGDPDTGLLEDPATWAV